MPVFAHPGPRRTATHSIPDLVAAGLMGIESYYTSTPRPRPPVTSRPAAACTWLQPGARTSTARRCARVIFGIPSVPLAVWESLKAKAALARNSQP